MLESRIFKQSTNPVCGFSMMEQVWLCCCLAHGELAWIFHEPCTKVEVFLGKEVREARADGGG